jgi:hypothetical protein
MATEALIPSPIMKGTTPTVKAFVQDIWATTLSHGRPRLYIASDPIMTPMISRRRVLCDRSEMRPVNHEART